MFRKAITSISQVAFLCALSFAAIAGQGASDSLALKLVHEDARSVLALANKMTEEAPNSATEVFELAESKASKDPLVLSDVWRDRGFAYEEQGNLVKALEYYTKAKNLAKKSKDAAREMTLLNDLAIGSRKARAYENAKNYHLECLALAKTMDDAEYVEFSLHGLGYLYESVGDFAEALIYYEKSRHEAQNRQDIEGEIITLSNIAHAYTAQKDTVNALLSIRLAWELALPNSDLLRQAHVAFNYGEILETVGQFEQSEQKFSAAAMRYATGKDFSSEIETHLNLARVLFKNNKIKAAEAALKTTLKRQYLLSPTLQLDAFLLMGRVEEALGNTSKALNYYQKGFSLAEVQNSKAHCHLALKGMSTCSGKEGRTADALFYLEKSNQYRNEYAESLLTQDNKELNFRFGLEKNEVAFQALKLRQNRIQTITIVTLGILLAFALGFALYWRRKNTALLSQKNEEIREQNERLESSNSFLHQFTYAVAHDMKEPLRTINGFTTLLDRKVGHKFEAEGKAYLGFLKSGVDRMHELVNSFLSFNSVSKETASFQRADGETAFVKAQNFVLNKVIHAHISKEEFLPAVQMHPNHLQHIFTQIIHNGIKFNTNAEPMVHVDAHAMEDNRIRFGFHDNGIGINPEYSNKIFDLFQQLNKDNPNGGVGIGLTMSKNIIEKYDGRIWFEADAELGGTVFWVELPAAA